MRREQGGREKQRGGWGVQREGANETTCLLAKLQLPSCNQHLSLLVPVSTPLNHSQPGAGRVLPGLGSDCITAWRLSHTFGWAPVQREGAALQP